jgi:Alpha/beta hydrolase domain
MRALPCAACVIVAAWATVAVAEVVSVEVADRRDVADARAFGAAGVYEKLSGTLRFAVDPKAAANARITDLALAPTAADGRVAFAADFYLLKPKELGRGNGALLLEVSNRGRKGILPMLSHAAGSLDPTTAETLGDGFLLEQGFTLLWVGWQFDVPADPALLHLVAPTATDRGAPLAGLVRSDFVVREAGVHDQSLGDGDHVPYAVADPSSPENTLTVRDDPFGERQVVAREKWQFAGLEDGGKVVADRTRVYLADGFEPKRIYEVVYTAENPRLAGLGLAALRDAATRLKHEGAPELGIAAGALDRALAFGISQSGRVLRTFIYEGFNQDERQRRVLDGVLAHIAGGARGGFDKRFAQPSRSSTSYLYPNELFPFTNATQTDPVTGTTDGLLARTKPAFLPKIFFTNSSNEYWRASAALTHLTADGERDLAPGDETRIYLFASTQHGPAAFPPRPGAGRLPGNPNSYAWFLRALLLKLDDWVAHGTSPPPSRYPTLALHTLVERDALAFPAIPGVAVPREVRAIRRLDFGPRFASEGVSTIEPPRVGAAYRMLLPQVDADGNDRDGLRSPELDVPLATYTGWNLYDPRLGRDDELVSLQGGFVPLPRDAAERERSGDPRRAILERYRDRSEYLARIAASAAALADSGYVRAADIEAILRDAGVRWDALVEDAGPR